MKIKARLTIPETVIVVDLEVNPVEDNLQKTASLIEAAFNTEAETTIKQIIKNSKFDILNLERSK